jgi:hypothetical protein
MDVDVRIIRGIWVPQSTADQTTDAASTFKLLANQRRIHVLDALDANGDEMGFEELAVEVASLESEGETLDEDHVDSVRTSLFHNHLPQLDNAALVEFDADARQVSLSAERSLRSLLDVVFEE